MCGQSEPTAPFLWRTVIDHLNPRERELVALGAALASNCIPCINHHIPLARKLGISDIQIRESIELADQVRQVPAIMESFP